MKPADWGVAVEKDDKIYLHITNPSAIKNKIELKYFPYTITEAKWFETGKTMEFKAKDKSGELELEIPVLNPEAIDQVIVLQVKK